MKANIVVGLVNTRSLTDDQMMELYRRYATDARDNRGKKIEKSIFWVIKQRTNCLSKVLKFATLLKIEVYDYGSTIKDILGDKLSSKIDKLNLNRLFVLARELDYRMLWKYVIDRVAKQPDMATDKQLLEVINLARYRYDIYESVFLPILEKRFSVEKMSGMTQVELLNQLWSISSLDDIEKSVFFKNTVLSIGNFDEAETRTLINLLPSPDQKLGDGIELLLIKRVSKMSLDELVAFVVVNEGHKKAQLLILKKLKLDLEGSGNLVDLYIRYMTHDLVKEFVIEELESRTFTNDELLAYGHRVKQDAFWVFVISRIELAVEKWLELGSVIDSEWCWSAIIERLQNH